VSQLALAFKESRRIDIMLDRLEDLLDELSAEQQARLTDPSSCSWWGVVVMVARLRAMERAEEEVLGGDRATMADAYDRIVQPGEHAVEAIMRTFRAVYGSSAP